METKYKKLSKTRGITVPRDMAANLDISAGTAVDLTATADGKLIITKHVDTCRFCDGTEKIRRFGDIFCCPLCAARLYEEVTADE